MEPPPRRSKKYPPTSRPHQRPTRPWASPRSTRSAGVRSGFARSLNIPQTRSWCLIRVAGCFVDANQKACRALGYTYDELMAAPIRAVHPNEMPAFRRFAFSVLEQGSGWSDEFTCTTKSGRSLSSEISAVGVDMDGQTVVIAMVRDITERKRAELALKRYADDLKEIVAERTAELNTAKERQQVLLQINNAIVNNLTREALFSAVATALRGVLSFDCASLVGLDGGRDLSTLYAFAGAPSPRLFPVGAKVPAKESRLRWVPGA